MKKLFFLYLLLIISVFPVFSKTINDGQIIPSDSQIYNDFLALQTNSKILSFTHNTPVSVAELKFYLKQYDYDAIDEYGKYLYDKLYDQLYEKETILPFDDFSLSLHPQINLEGYYKTNKDIPWSFKYYYKDNFISMPLDLGFGENLAMGADFFLGKSYIAASKQDNFCNIPLDFKKPGDVHFTEFYFPTFAYAGIAKTYDKWGFNLHIAKQGKSIGQTLTGSIIYNKTFETDAYIEFDVFTNKLKYTTDVVQISSNRMDNIQQDNTERYLYIHQFDVRFFKKIKLSVMEASLIAAPFSIRFLNPLPFMHQFGGWTNYITENNKDIYKETNFCADFAYMLEYIPIKNLRIYGLYNQIEMQLPWERGNSWGRYYPNSIGIQLGTEYNLILNDNSNILFALEGFYNSPYMYIKQTPSASLYRLRQDMQTKQYIYSWIGSPYGPDCAGGIFKTEYNSNKNWKFEINYTFIVKGENDFALFEKTVKDSTDESEYYDYYPSVKYKLRKKGIVNDGVTDDELYEEATNLGISGSKQITNQIKLNGTWFINNYLEMNGQFAYSFIINNIKHRNNSGIEMDLSVKYKFF